MNIIDIFIGVFLSFIAKDFYDIFIKSFIVSWLSNYKILITKLKKGEKIK
jgi:hypothetical protein